MRIPWIVALWFSIAAGVSMIKERSHHKQEMIHYQGDRPDTLAYYKDLKIDQAK